MKIRIPYIPIAGWWPIRYYIPFVAFVGLMASYILRFCICLAILDMTRPHTHEESEDACFEPPATDNTTIKQRYDFNWTSFERDQILAAYFIGYVVFQIPAGWAGDMLGSKPPMVTGMMMTSALSIITPEFAFLGPDWLYGLRVAMGASQAVFFSPLHCILSAWIPKKERSTIGAFMFSGVHAGSCINHLLTGLLLGPANLHWSWVFRVYGILGFVWCLWYLFTCYSYPDQCECLSEKEKQILEEAGLMIRQRHPNPPWFAIITNYYVWVSVIGTFGHGWILFSIVTQLPSYFSSVFGISTSSNGYTNCVMFVCIWLTAIFGGFFADWLNRKQLISLVWNRKILSTLASVFPTLGLIWTVYSYCDLTLALVVVILGTAFLGFFYGSLKLTGVDMSTQYSGTVSSFINAIAGISGFIAPEVIGYLTPHGSLKEWRNVMWLTFGVAIITQAIFIGFGTATTQPFDSIDPNEVKEAKQAKKEAKQAKKEAKQAKKEAKRAEKEAERAGKGMKDERMKEDTPIKLNDEQKADVIILP